MIASLRSAASVFLLLGLLSGQAAACVVLAHVAIEHAAPSDHHDHGAGIPHAGHHDTGAGDRHAEHGHAPGHTHEIAPTSALAPARIAGPALDLTTCVALVREARFTPPDAVSLASPAPSTSHPRPPGPKRQSILLL